MRYFNPLFDGASQAEYCLSMISLDLSCPEWPAQVPTLDKVTSRWVV
jgi:hypothetical protein